MSNRSIAALVLGFLFICIALNFLNVTNYDLGDILGYTITILGLSLVYTAFKSDGKLLAFVGSGIFLTGVAIIIFNVFELTSSSEYITPMLLIISGLSVIMVWLLDFSKKTFLFIGLIIFLAGLTLIFISAPSKILLVFQNSIWVFTTLWPLIIILVAIVFISFRENKKR